MTLVSTAMRSVCLLGIVACVGFDVEPPATPPDRAVTLTVVLAGEGKGSVASSDGKLQCTGSGTTCKMEVALPGGDTKGVPVILSVTPDLSSGFGGWTGDCGTASQCVMNVSGDATVVATFTAKVALTIDFQPAADALSTLSSDPPGVAARDKGTSVAYFDKGTTVSLNLAQPPGGEVFRFDGACTGTNGRLEGPTCRLTMDAPKKLQVRAAHYNYAFLTSSKHTGALGGLAGADTVCNELATKAQLPGRFAAFLSATGVAASMRLGSAEGWRRTDDLAFIESKAAVFSAGATSSSPDHDETGGVPADFDRAFERAHTGSLANGQPLAYAGESFCGNWTSTNGQVSQGAAVTSNRFWLTAGAGPCAAPRRFYCLGTDLDRPIPKTPAPANARKAFLSRGTVTPSGGLASFDDLCKAEAAAAGLARSAQYLALVAPADGTASASRFDLTKGLWVGTDGTVLATDAAALMKQLPWRSGIHRLADGAVEQGQPDVLTGYRVSTAVAAPRPMDPGTDTCSGWTSASAAAPVGFGQFGFTGHYALSVPATSPGFCAATAWRVYCLEN